MPLNLLFDLEVQKINFPVEKLRQNSENNFMSRIKTIRIPMFLDGHFGQNKPGK